MVLYRKPRYLTASYTRQNSGQCSIINARDGATWPSTARRRPAAGAAVLQYTKAAKNNARAIMDGPRKAARPARVGMRHSTGDAQ